MAVFFKASTPLGSEILFHLGELEIEQIRGLGKVHVHEAKRVTVYFVPLKEDFSFNAKRYVDAFVSGVGRPECVVSLVSSANLELYATGNLTSSNPLLHPSFSPRSVSPVHPDLLGTTWLVFKKIGVNPRIVAVHDPPSDLHFPHVRIGLPKELAGEVVPVILASARRPRVFVPYVTVSRGYAATHFEPLFERRHISAYHVPYYWAHFLDEEMFEQMRAKGGVRKVLVERGLILPGELPQKEV